MNLLEHELHLGVDISYLPLGGISGGSNVLREKRSKVSDSECGELSVSSFSLSSRIDLSSSLLLLFASFLIISQGARLGKYLSS